MKNKNYINLLPGSTRLLFSRTIALVCFMALFITGAMAQTVTIGTGVTASGSFDNGNPIYRSSAASGFGWSISGHVYTAAQLSAIPSGSTINSIAFDKTSTAGTAAGRTGTLKIYMRNSTNTTLSTATTLGTVQGYSLVLNNTAATIPTTAGFVTWTLSSPFTYTGGSLEIYVDWAVNGASSGLSTGAFNWRFSTGAGTQTIGNSSSAAFNASSLFASSQTRSYNLQVNYTPGAPCSGTPAPGNTIASAASVCNGSNVNLSLQNNTSGSGVSYQWQQSDDNATWNNFGPNSSSASFTMGATAKYFQCIVTCGSNSGTSNSVLVNVNAFNLCYCPAVPTSVDGNGVVNFTFGSFSNPNISTSPYQNFTSLTPPTLFINSTTSATVSLQTGFTYRCRVFIDYNQDGDYLDAGEMNDLGLSSNVNPTTQTGNIVVPAGAATGVTGMRLVCTDGDATNDPCYSSSWANVEDYLVNIIPEPVCINPPTAGTATSTISQFCNIATVNPVLDLTGNSAGAGQSYQWEESPDGSTWTPISGATTKQYTYTGLATSTYFQCQVTCGASTVASSSVFVEAVDPPIAGSITGPSSAFVNQAAVYSSAGEAGNLQWQARLLPSGIFANVPGGTNNPQNIFFGAAGSYEIRLVTSVPGCTSENSDPVTTVVTIQNDNVCNALPVNLGINGPYSNTGATIELGEAQPPTTGCNINNGWCAAPQGTISNTVWFTFTVPTGGSGRYGFALPGWDSQVAIWSASACGDLLSGAATLIAANDDSAGSPFNAYARGFCLTPGQTYYIQVDGYGAGTNGAFALRIDDFGPANPSFTGLPASICQNAASVTLVPAVAGGTFSGPGVSGSTFNPSVAGAGLQTVTYTLSGLDACYSSSQQINVIAPSFTYYIDADNDTYGNPAVSIQSCSPTAPSGYVANNGDCNDASVAINPGASEACNNIDDDCDGLTDEDFDQDGDGFTTCGGDCDDSNNAIFPGAAEVCNNIDDDCDLSVDEGLTFITYYQDADGDTYGNASATVSTCNGAPSGYVSDNTDCNDGNAAVNPGATEICNSIDDDCDGQTDENLLVAGPISGPAVQCVAVVTGSATYSISPVFDATSYNWSVPSGMTILGGQGTNSIFVSWSPAAVSAGIVGPLTVVPSNGCGSGTGSSVNIDINYTAPVRPSSISGAARLCPGDVATYSVLNVARASSFTWSVPTGVTITSGQGTNVINVSVGGAYTGGIISVFASNACGNGPARTRAVSQNTPPAPASISGPASGVCGALGVAYTAASVPSATGYFWTAPAGATIVSGQGTQVVEIDFSGSFSPGVITVSATNSCGTGAARSLSVTGAPGQPGPITGDVTICLGQANVPYSIATVSGASLYTWAVPGGSSIASGQGTKDIFVNWGTNPAVGQVITVTASNGCGTSPIRSLSGIVIDVSNCIRLGEQGAITGLNVFPNPAVENANIVFNGTNGADFNLRLVDMTGRTVFNERGTAVDGINQRILNVNHLSAGIYFIMLETNGTVEQIRFMVD